MVWNSWPWKMELAERAGLAWLEGLGYEEVHSP